MKASATFRASSSFFFFHRLSSLTNENSFSHFAHFLNALWHISRMCTRLNGVEVPKIPLATPKSEKYVKRPCRLTSQEKWTLKIKFVTNYGWGGWLIAGFAAVAVYFFHPISASLASTLNAFSKWKENVKHRESAFCVAGATLLLSVVLSEWEFYYFNPRIAASVAVRNPFFIISKARAVEGLTGATQKAF